MALTKTPICDFGKKAQDFKLKSIAKIMKKHNMININLDSNCKSGMTAMIEAFKCYENEVNPTSCEIMQDIIKYNEFDCKVLWQIISYLRQNHI